MSKAFVKAGYGKDPRRAKANIRYIDHRPSRDGTKITRQLFSWNGEISRKDAYTLIDQAARSSKFFRFVISPDPGADRKKDLDLQDLTYKTMDILEQCLRRPLHWIAADHTDQTPDHRHVHVLAIVQGRIEKRDLDALRMTIEELTKEQRRVRDMFAPQQQARAQEEGLELELVRERTLGPKP